MHISSFLEVFCPVFLALSGALGLLAVVSPQHFRAAATRSARWVDSQRYLALLDKPHDIDRLVLAHSRFFGSLVVTSVALLAYLFLTR